jgi:ABC-type branched-subunit amino acid transport system ATPase component
MSDVILLKAESLTRHFDGLAVLDRASVVVARGQSLGIVGENGNGKTTLLNLLSGADRPDGGRVLFASDGSKLCDITKWSSWKRARHGLLYYFQQPHIWRNLTVRENVLAAATEAHLDGSIGGTLRWCLSRQLRGLINCRCEDLLDLVELRDRADDVAGELSYGQMKLLALARILARPTRQVLLLDEPTAGIAPALIGRLVDLLKRIRGDGIGMLVVEHDREMLRGLTDSVVELRDGRISGLREVA